MATRDERKIKKNITSLLYFKNVTLKKTVSEHSCAVQMQGLLWFD